VSLRFGDLIPRSAPGLQKTLADRVVTGLALDSRKVEPGAIFFALAGSRADGLAYAAEAAARGAAVIIGEADAPAGLPPTAAYIKVKDARRLAAMMAARFHPRQPATIVAVTGTAGKSSVADFARQIFAACGCAAASVGTLGVIAPSGAAYGALTTPDPVTLHQTLDALAGEGVTHLAIEASSHGLDQRRLDGVALAAAAFTNLGRDHLDYHPTMQAYLEAKLRLFTTLLRPGLPAVINADGDRSADVIAAALARGLEIVSVGKAGRDLSLEGATIADYGQALSIVHAGRRHEVRLPLIGAFQAENALVAAGLALAVGLPADGVFPALATLRGVPGRLDTVGRIEGAPVFVDYAHKPEALEHVLASLRPFTSGRLVVAFGCGGDRDRGKRPIMGAIATRLADVVIVTDDNPRSEAPAAIRAEILAAAPGAREIGDRAEAIGAAVAGLSRGDCLVIAGKGHETGQIVGGVTHPFSDHAVARAAILAEAGRRGVEPDLEPARAEAAP
jgi:UDP-N-acetylmuramoyl-L-alanyl-D-glutamate--2,6-diaminopimelate ligase